MEIHFSELSFQATTRQVERAFANILHGSRYLPESMQPWNFKVYIYPPKRNQWGRKHRGCGSLTVPQAFLGHRLLDDFGGASTLSIAGRKIKLQPSIRQPNAAVLEKIRREPFVPLDVRERLEAIRETFQTNTVGIRTLQFGWETRSGVFSVEWEKDFQSNCSLTFNDTRRAIRIKLMDQPDVIRFIEIHWSQISWSATGFTDEGDPTIFLSLYSAPAFDIEGSGQARIQSVLDDVPPIPEKRRRLLAPYPDDPDLIRVLPYATLCIRLLCHSSGDLKTFIELSKVARLPAPKDFTYQAEHLDLFSETKLKEYHQWTSELNWTVAFQVEALLRGRLADTKEVLSIRPLVEDMIACEGVIYTANFLRSAVSNAAPEVQGDHEGAFEASIKSHAEEDFSWSPPPHPWDPKDGVFHCLHVSISPTSMKLDGPFPERPNRILRTYADDHDSFIRVSFVEENDLRYQQDREVDGPEFIGRWVTPILKNGFTIADRRFNFLAYSQSALKAHTLWFVKDFINPSGGRVTPATIIRDLGRFEGLEYDPQLIFCPARYAARISQAFTTTDSSISVQAEEILIQDDIKRNGYCFTDGVGNISPRLAGKIWKELQKRASRSTRRATTLPRAFQIRLVGAKGMLSVDHKLSGDVIILRRSMIKFDAPHSTDVEIAQAFVRPSKYFLNRPLIMVLEGLGIHYNVFRNLQEEAVQEVDEATTSLEKAARILDQFGLATSYRVSSSLLHLAKLGMYPEIMDDFYDQMLAVSIYHILRDLKHYSRIPVNDGYTLVGVADIHEYLCEGEVFACVTVPETDDIQYLSGDVLVSRSPIIHPGDVQVVRAIGRPPLGSPFARECLPNTIVFSVNGARPLPSYLGGGDLDGDVYNVTWFKDLHPSQNIPPAAYTPAPKKLLPRPSTMDDVADFVADYINNDILGMVSINWLMIADLNSIFYEDCIKLCQIHSDAVDYPKSGTPVALSTVPKPRSDLKPDWHAPETVDLGSSDGYYQSQKAIGRLFRAIDLPEVRPRNRETRRNRRHVRDAAEPDLDEIFAALCIGDRHDPLKVALERRVAKFIRVEPHSEFVKLAIESLDRYAVELQGICATNTPQRHKNAMLSEEEAVIGTVVAKCSQKRRRKEAISQLREQSNYLVKTVRDELSGDDNTSKRGWLATAWTAWQVSRHLKDRFGAHSFGWIALGEIFDAIKAIE